VEGDILNCVINWNFNSCYICREALQTKLYIFSNLLIAHLVFDDRLDFVYGFCVHGFTES